MLISGKVKFQNNSCNPVKSLPTFHIKVYGGPTTLRGTWPILYGALDNRYFHVHNNKKGYENYNQFDSMMISNKSESFGKWLFLNYTKFSSEGDKDNDKNDKQQNEKSKNNNTIEFQIKVKKRRKKDVEEEKKSEEGEEDGEEGGGEGGKGSSNFKIPPEMHKPLVFLIIGIILYAIVFILSNVQNETSLEVLGEKYISKGIVTKIVATKGYNVAQVYLLGESSARLSVRTGRDMDLFEERIELYTARYQVPDIPVYFNDPVITNSDVFSLLLLLSFFLVYLPSRRGVGGGIESFLTGGSKKHIRLFKPDPNVKGIKFADVAGLAEAKTEVLEFVDFLSRPEKYKALGAKIPKGAMLVGPPGTGKTLLAKAMANEASVPFFSASGSDFVEMIGGLGPARVRSLFEEARKVAPCIIWIDEIDAIGKKRSSGGFVNDERENTLNQILVEMDGFHENSGIVVLAGTNRPEMLDSALLRPGRFDRQIAISYPDISSREQIFLVHLKPLKLIDEYQEDLPKLAKRLAAITAGYSGADIANVCNEAALIAARNDKEAIDLLDFEAAVERVVGGIERKSLAIPSENKKTIAYHEAGHAAVGWFLEHSPQLIKVSIVPRSQALGYAAYLPKDQYLYTFEQLMDRMTMTMGGRVSEQIFFESVTTGARDDLQKVTDLAYKIIKDLGMNSIVGNVSYGQFEGNYQPRIYSDETQQLIDTEANKLIRSAYDRAYSIITEHRDKVEKLALMLLEKEIIQPDMLKEIFGDRPWTCNNKASEFYDAIHHPKSDKENDSNNDNNNVEDSNNEVKNEKQ